MTPLPDVYVTAVHVHEVFAGHTCQRPVNNPRAKEVAAGWDRCLAGVLEVSDRGEHATPRYAVIDGQHRWAAAALLHIPPALVANVHTALAVAQNAALFDNLNRERRGITTRDHWHALRCVGDQVLTIENIAKRCGLAIDMSPKDDNVRCTATLEKLYPLGGPGSGLVPHYLKDRGPRRRYPANDSVAKGHYPARATRARRHVIWECR